jgi:predicted lactoylglutathione lyase
MPGFERADKQPACFPAGNYPATDEFRPYPQSVRPELNPRRESMADNRSRKIFVNLPVRNLKASMEFFSKLGFEFNRQFTDDKAACMIISEDAFAMLLTEPFFRTFTKREPCDTTKQTEALLALSCNSRTDVDAMVKKALDGGGKPAMNPVDYGFMYGWSFYDLDGHHWEPLWMDPKHVQ